MSFARYPLYRDSGVESLSDVPAHWSVQRLRTVAKLNPSKTELRDWDRETLVSFLPMEAIGEDGSLDLSRERPISDMEGGYSYVRDGDVAVAKITPCFENGKGARMVGLRNGVGFGTTELIVVRPDETRLIGAYLHYLFNSRGFREQGEAHMYGAGGQQRVPDAFIRNFVLPLPPVTEQNALVTFLDKETAKLDALVAEQHRLIALLREKRQAVISHAVTTGLDRLTPLKASGVEWLLEVPAHWRVLPIRKAARLESGHTPSRAKPEYWENCTVPWFTLADVWQIRETGAEYVRDTKEKISELGLANSAARLLPAGTVMLSRTASVGFSTIMGVPMATTQDFANWVCGPDVRAEYLLYAFRSMSAEFDRLKMGSTHNTIYMPDIQAMRFALPPLEEQDVIVEHVRREAGRFDELVREAERAVALLQERRTALISAAVTGQINVRAHAPAEALAA